jgi:hypothetical protein
LPQRLCLFPDGIEQRPDVIIATDTVFESLDGRYRISSQPSRFNTKVVISNIAPHIPGDIFNRGPELPASV